MTRPDIPGVRTYGHHPRRGCPKCPESGASDLSGVCPELCPDRVRSIKAWLKRIGETDNDTIDHVLTECRHTEARAYYLARAGEIPTSAHQHDDRIRCLECRHLDRKVCTVASPHGVVIAARGYQPQRTKPQRCEAYAAKAHPPARPPPPVSRYLLDPYTPRTNGVPK